MTDRTSIAAEDQRLRNEAAKATKMAANAQMRLDAYRWEQCACPDGPQYSQREYAEMVGVQEAAIRKSVTAWREGASRTGRACTLGAPHPRDAEQPPADNVDTGSKTTEEHESDRTKARVGDENAEIVKEMSAVTGKAQSTITNNTNWTPLLRRAKELVREGESIEDAVQTAIDEDKAEKARIKALRVKVKRALIDAGLDHGPKEVNAIIGQADVPPTWEAAEKAIAAEVKRIEIRKKLERKQKENEAKEDSRPAWFLPVVGIPVAMLKTGEDEKAKIRGDMSAMSWDEQTRDLWNQEIDKVQAFLEMLRLIPDNSSITPEAIIEGGAL